MVKSDYDRMRPVMLVFLDNAVECTPSGGAVTVEVRRAGSSADPTIRDPGTRSGELSHIFELVN